MKGIITYYGPALSMFLVPAVIAPAFCAMPARAAEEPRVRVLLAEKVSAALVKGSGLSIRPVDSDRPCVSGIGRACFSPEAGKVSLAGSGFRAPGFETSSADGFCEVNGAAVRGRLLVLPRPEGLTLVVSVPLEAYLVGLVNGEISSGWPDDAVKAQVVAARTYAMRRMASARDEPYDVRADTSHQVYPGVFGEDGEAARAVRATRGLALYRDGSLLEAVFHSNCGGRTASAEEVWGVPVPGLESVICGDCGDAPQARWEGIFSAAEVEEAVRRLYPGAGRVLSLSIRSLTPGGRVRALAVTAAGGAFLLDAGDLRRELGNVRLPSTCFTVSASADGSLFVFSGRGYGHGAGLCQWGARGAAKRGLAFREILSRYYPGSEVRKAYP